MQVEHFPTMTRESSITATTRLGWSYHTTEAATVGTGVGGFTGGWNCVQGVASDRVGICMSRYLKI